MARDFDPENLTGGDVLRIVAPVIAVIVAFGLVLRFAPQFFWLLLILLIGGFYVYFAKLPKEDVAAMREEQRKLENRIGSIPVVGPIAKTVLRMLNWPF